MYDDELDEIRIALVTLSDCLQGLDVNAISRDTPHGLSIMVWDIAEGIKKIQEAMKAELKEKRNGQYNGRP
jgi:hypothetical protein